MKKCILIMLCALCAIGTYSQTNTFPNRGSVGIGTTNPETELQIGDRSSSLRLSLQGPNIAPASSEILFIDGSGTIPYRNGTGIRYNSDANYLSIDDNYNEGNSPNKSLFIVNWDNGNVGIGTTDPKAKLSVNGTIVSKEIKVLTDISQYPDFVFSAGYELRTIHEVADYIEKNGHLPEIPKAEEVKNGLPLGALNAKLLQKIEELTLYTIAQQKELDKQEAMIADLKKQNAEIDKLKKQNERIMELLKSLHQ